MPNTPFEEVMGIEIKSTNHKELIETANKLYSTLKENEVPTKDIAEIVIDPNGLSFDLSYANREKERRLFKRALGGKLQYTARIDLW